MSFDARRIRFHIGCSTGSLLEEPSDPGAARNLAAEGLAPQPCRFLTFDDAGVRSAARFIAPVFARYCKCDSCCLTRWDRAVHDGGDDDSVVEIEAGELPLVRADLEVRLKRIESNLAQIQALEEVLDARRPNDH